MDMAHNTIGKSLFKNRILGWVVILFFASAQGVYGATATVDLLVVIESGESTILVSPTVLNMGTLTRTADQFRFPAGPITVEFSALQPADISTYTDDPQDRRGMIGTNGDIMELRGWTANFGPGTGGTPPDPQDDANWSNPQTGVWSPVREVDADGEKLVLIEGVVSTGDAFDVFVAVNSLGVELQAYGAQMIFEIVNQ